MGSFLCIRPLSRTEREVVGLRSQGCLKLHHGHVLYILSPFFPVEALVVAKMLRAWEKYHFTFDWIEPTLSKAFLHRSL
jgi:hypothetical protein